MAALTRAKLPEASLRIRNLVRTSWLSVECRWIIHLGYDCRMSYNVKCMYVSHNVENNAVASLLPGLVGQRVSISKSYVYGTLLFYSSVKRKRKNGNISDVSVHLKLWKCLVLLPLFFANIGENEVSVWQEINTLPTILTIFFVLNIACFVNVQLCKCFVSVQFR